MRPSTILAALAFVVWAVAGGLTVEQRADGIPLSLCIFAGLVAVTVTMLWAACQNYMAMSRADGERLVVPPAWAEDFAAHAREVAGRYVSRPVPVVPCAGEDDPTLKMETGTIKILDRPVTTGDPAYDRVFSDVVNGVFGPRDDDPE